LQHKLVNFHPERNTFSRLRNGLGGRFQKPGELFLKVTFSLGAIAEFNAAKMQSPQPEGLTPSVGFRWREFLVSLLVIAPFDSDRAIV
jgi:hypothetical protein